MPKLRHLVLLALFLGLSAVLGLKVREELSRTPRLDAAGPAGEAPAADGGALPVGRFEAPPPESYAVALERPLFDPTRRPPEPQAPAPAAQPVVRETPFRGVLKGVLLDGPQRVALVAADGAGQPLRLSEGDLYLGWTLEEIHPDRVVFVRGEERKALALPYRPGAR